jgi:hypothetical protein
MIYQNDIDDKNLLPKYPLYGFNFIKIEEEITSNYTQVEHDLIEAGKKEGAYRALTDICDALIKDYFTGITIERENLSK